MKRERRAMLTIELCFAGINAQPLPNSTMEIWHFDTITSDPPPYMTNNAYAVVSGGQRTVLPVQGCSGQYGMMVRSTQLQGGQLEQGVAVAFIPYTGIIDSFKICLKASVKQGDTAFVVVAEDSLFKQGFQQFADYAFFILLTSDTIPIFIEASGFPLIYNPAGTSDTLAIGVIVKSSSAPAGSYVVIDSLRVWDNGTLVSVPNASFEQWFIQRSTWPDGWRAPLDFVNSPSPTCDTSTDAFQGTFAAKLIPQYIAQFGMEVSWLTYGNDLTWLFQGTDPIQPLPFPPDSIHFAWKFVTANPNDDTAFAVIQLFKWNQTLNKRDTIKDTVIFLSPSGLWQSTKIYVPSSSAPDSITIGFAVYRQGVMFPTYLLIDSVSLIKIVGTGDRIEAVLMGGPGVSYSPDERALLVNNTGACREGCQMIILDSRGEIILSAPINASTRIVPFIPPATGIYSYQIIPAGGRKLYPGRVFITK